MAPCSLTKRERLVSKKLIDELFGGDKRKALSAYPLRMVYLLREGASVEAPVQVLVSVPKRHLKHAVDRNRVKRQIRESYRRQKQSLIDRMNGQGQSLAIAFIWQANQLYPTHEIAACVEKLFMLLAKRCWD